MADYEDYEEEEGGYYDGEDDTDYYVGVVRSKLEKGAKIADEAIIAQLELYEYDTDKVIKAIKAQLKPKAAPNAAGAGKGPTGNKPAAGGAAAKPATATSNQGKPSTSTSGKATAITNIAGETSSSVPDSIFQKAQQTSQGSAEVAALHVTVEDLHLSDDEITPPPAKAPASASSADTPHHKPELTMVVVGHVDAGKSTLVGNLLRKLGKVNQRTMHKYEKDSAAIGKSSFSLAWVMDERQAERERGVTIDIAERSLSTEHRSFTILDAPGHRDFVPNMIKGAAQADVALLVVPATEGEYETCMKDSAQTKEHATLLKALGVNQVVVVVNKMDKTEPSAWNAERYFRIEAELRQFLVQDLSFHEKLVRCVPVSGFAGENLLEMSNECAGKAWYSGPTLHQLLDSFHVPPQQIDKAFRAVVTNVRSVSKHEYELQVNVLQGKIRRGRSIGLASYTASHCKLHGAVVQSLQALDVQDSTETADHHHQSSSSSASIPVLVARERGIIRIASKPGCETLELNEGHEIICFKGPPALQPVHQFKANITTMTSLENTILPGSRYELYLKGVEMQCTISTLHSMSGSTKKPKCIPGGKSAIVTVTVEQKTVVEPFSTCRALGRFALRSKGATIAVGLCE